MTKLFQASYFLFLVVMALVVGGACYQTMTVSPLWQQDVSTFRNYGHWGINYFPILSPLMTVLWIVILITGFRTKFPKKSLLWIGHLCFLIIMASTFIYFAPFLLNNMGKVDSSISDQQLLSMIQTWTKWDLIRQIFGLIPLAIFIYCYGNIKLATR